MDKPILTAEYLRSVLSYDPMTGIFQWIAKRQGASLTKPAGALNAYGYRKVYVDGRSYGAHRLAFLYMTGSWPADQVDHINCDRADNRWKNLRQVTNHENRFNLAKQRREGTGVYARHGKWRAAIRVNNKLKHLGVFTRYEDAVKARREAVDRHFVIPTKDNHMGPPQGGFSL